MHYHDNIHIVRMDACNFTHLRYSVIFDYPKSLPRSYLVHSSRFNDHLQRYNGILIWKSSRENPIDQIITQKDVGRIYRWRSGHHNTRRSCKL